METKYGSDTISRLPAEIAMYICTFIRDEDLFNALEAIPVWHFIYPSKWFESLLHKRVKKWSWIDEHVYKFLCPQPSPETYLNVIAAYVYRVGRDNYYASLPRDSSTNLGKTLRVNLVAPNKRSTCSIFANYDCIIFFVHTPTSASRDLGIAFSAIAPHQTLSIVVTRDEPTDGNDITYLIEFINNLGGLDELLSKNSSIHWRLWCLHRMDNRLVETKEFKKWIQDALVWSSIQRRANAESASNQHEQEITFME